MEKIVNGKVLVLRGSVWVEKDSEESITKLEDIVDLKKKFDDIEKSVERHNKALAEIIKMVNTLDETLKKLTVKINK